MAGWLKKDYLALIFEAGTIPVAYALYRKEEDHIYLRQFFVDRKCRRKGHGKKAMRMLFEKVWPKGTRVVLEVLIHNRMGRAFWKSAGFKPYCLTLERHT